MKKLLLLLIPFYSFGQVSDATIKTNTNTNIRNASTVTRANHAAINDQLTDAKSSRIEAVTLSGTNTYTANIVWASSYQTGLNFLATFVNANTGSATLNVNSLGAKTLKKFSGGSKVDLVSGDISAGQIYQLVYDGTFFQVSIPGAGGGGGTWGSITGTISSQTDLQTALDGKLNLNGSNANTDIDIGANNVSSKGVRITGTGGNGDLHLKHQSSASTASASSSSLWADSNGNLNWSINGNYRSTFSTYLNTANQSYLLPDASGTVALLTSLSATSPLSYNGSGGFSIPAASTSVSGHLTSTDWNTFNNKVSEYSNYYKVTTWAALQTYVAGLGAGVDVNIFFPYGTYTATSTLTFSNKGNVNIIGEGSIIVNGVSTASDVFNISSVTSINIQGLFLDFNGNSNVGDFFDISTVTNIARFENLYFRNYGASTQAGFRLLNVPNPSANGQNFNEAGASFTNCVFSNSINYATYDYNSNNTKGIGIYMTDAVEYFNINHCFFINVNVGLWAINGGNGKIINSTFNGTLARISGTNYGAIYMVGGGSNGGKLLITNCTFNHNWGYGIWNDYNVTGRPLEIINSHFIANAITPIVINNTTSNNQIMNCFFDRANLASTGLNNPYGAVTSRYIYINNSSSNTISDNSFLTGVSGTAIVTLGTSGANKIRNNDLASGVTLASLVATTDIVSGNDRKWTFQPDATVFGINTGSYTSTPSAPVNGDIGYNSTSNNFEGRINGTTRNFVFDGNTQTLTNKTLGTGTAIALGSDATGDIYANSGGSLVRIAAGATSGHVLTSNGSGVLPSWQAPTGGGGGFTNPMTTGGDLIYGGASGTATRLANGSSGQYLTSQGGTSAPIWSSPTSSGLSYGGNATDADFTIAVNSIKNLPPATLTANRNITIPAGTNGDYIEIFNKETGFTWNLIGATVYLADETTTVTSLLYNAPIQIRFVNGKWIVEN